MGTIIKNMENIVVSDWQMSLFSNFQMALALYKWPQIDLKFCMLVGDLTPSDLQNLPCSWKIGDTSLHGDPTY
jgi:hypothetical protein